MNTAPAPTVSVIIPTYNRAGLIVEAIDSVLGQSIHDYEIIVVDDGSTDDTEARVRAYGDRVRYIRTQQGGVAHARNVGMRHARGRYVTFLDSDDRLYPYALEIESNLLDRFPTVGLVCAEMSGFDDAGFFERYHLKVYHRSAYRDPSVTYDRMFGSCQPLAEVAAVPPALLAHDPAASSRAVYKGNVFDSYLLNLILCQNSVMLRRDVAERAGERNTAIRYWEELDYLLRITRAHTICFVDVPTYQLRYHPGQLSTTGGSDGTYRWIRKQQILLRVVKRHALADADYYLSRRSRIDQHLAHLHRGVAVPLLLCKGGTRTRRRYVRYAKLYLSRCARFGYPAPVLRLASVTPEPFRCIAVRLIETARDLRWRLVNRLSMSGAKSFAQLVSERAYF